MTREVPLPIEFAALSGRVSYVTRRGHYEYSSSCPSCGGTPHQGGTWPDRFRMFTVSRARSGKALGWCRSCGFTWWPEKEQGQDWKPDPAAAAAWIAEREQSEAQRMAEVTRALELLDQEKVWIRYHANLTDDVREMYRGMGIPEFWVDFLQLGYNPEKWFASAGQNYISPSLTFPCFQPGSWKVLNIKHRLLRPADPDDKYRPEVKGLPPALYSPDPDHKLTGRALLVEGEKKSIVTNVTLDDPNLLVLGQPGKSPDEELWAQLKDCEPVILCYDPDAYVRKKKEHHSPIERAVKYFGKRARVMFLPDKIDDLILRGALNKFTLRSLMDNARAMS